jgi:anti-sigma B factor antagonist
MDDISVTHEGGIAIVGVTGERDLSNVDALNDALKAVLSDQTTSCLLDLSGLTFMDSTVIHALVRWSKEAQVSEREALAIMVGGPDTPAARVLGLVGMLKRLPVFGTREAAMLALERGRRPRPERPLRWLSDLELASERDEAQIGAEAANRRLDDATAEQKARARRRSSARRLTALRRFSRANQAHLRRSLSALRRRCSGSPSGRSSTPPAPGRR